MSFYSQELLILQRWKHVFNTCFYINGLSLWRIGHSRHCFVDIHVRKSYQRPHSNGLLSLNDLSHCDVIIWRTQGCWFQRQSFPDWYSTIWQCRFFRWAESRVSPTLKVPLSTELNKTVCSMSLLCPRIWSLRGCSSDVLMGEKNVLL